MVHRPRFIRFPDLCGGAFRSTVFGLRDFDFYSPDIRFATIRLLSFRSLAVRLVFAARQRVFFPWKMLGVNGKFDVMGGRTPHGHHGQGKLFIILAP